MKLAIHGYGATGHYVHELAPDAVVAVIDKTKTAEQCPVLRYACRNDGVGRCNH